MNKELTIVNKKTYDDEHLGLDVIDQVGPGGTFIDQMHTGLGTLTKPND